MKPNCFGEHIVGTAKCIPCTWNIICQIEKEKRIAGGVTAETMNIHNALNTQVGGSHYKDMPIQPIEFCHKNKLGACETLAIKYLCRHKQKNGAEDLKKAIHCIELLIEMEYPNGNQQ